QFFELADIAANARRRKGSAAISPVALEAIKRIDALFDIERGINGLVADERLRVRQNYSAPLMTALEAWLREERFRLSRAASVAQSIARPLSSRGLRRSLRLWRTAAPL